MDVIISRCAGLDVHKDTVVACLRCLEPGGKVCQEIRTYETVTRGLFALREWLESEAVTHVAMESTGVYWKPVFNILEGGFAEILVVNAHHIKQVPGRKTDVKDCEWIAKLLQHGLLKASFIPSIEIRELRDLTRTRTKLQQEHSRIANRIQKVLEDANIKLGSVATDVLGASGRSMIVSMIGGETDAHRLADQAKRKLRDKLPQLRSALEGRVTEHHRFLLRIEWERLLFLEGQIAQLDQRVEALTVPFEEILTLMDSHVGVGIRTAQILLAELGPNMSQFPTAGNLASWVGVSPGNHESAGKRKTGRTTKGNRWARAALTEAAWAATRAKKSYCGALFRRIAGRRGKKRAVLAVAHAILVAIYHMLSRNQPYRDLGADYLDKQNKTKLAGYYVRRLKSLGVSVVIADDQAAA